MGYEMLMRWEHKGKMIPPSRFIPLSEKTGLIRYIDQRGLEFAALRCEHLYQQKKFLTVNLSPLNLNSKEYFYFLKRITERTPNFSDVVHLEITETAVVNNVKSFLKLSKLNPNLIMDDFGSGFAHFALFYRLASKGIIKKIKIDKAFFQEMIKDHLRGIGFLKRLIGAFNSLGVDVLVEGVETLMQYETLRGIDLPIQIQGYYLGRPEAIGN